MKQKYISSPKNCVRYQRQIIRYCLTLAVKSLSLYDDIRFDGNGHTYFLMLSRRQCLRDCKNYIRSAGGFNKGFNEIKEFYKDVGNFQQEKKCLKELVWDKHTDDLIRYVDLGHAKLNAAALEKQKNFIQIFSRSTEV